MKIRRFQDRGVRKMHIYVFPAFHNEAAIRIEQTTMNRGLPGKFGDCTIDCSGLGGLTLEKCIQLLAGWSFAIGVVIQWNAERSGKYWSPFSPEDCKHPGWTDDIVV